MVAAVLRRRQGGACASWAPRQWRRASGKASGKAASAEPGAASRPRGLRATNYAPSGRPARPETGAVSRATMKSMLRAAGCVVAFAMAASPAGAPASAQTAPARTTLTMGVGAPVTSIDPHYHQLSPNNAVADMIFDGLVSTDSQARPIRRTWPRVARGGAERPGSSSSAATCASTTAARSPPRTWPSPSSACRTCRTRPSSYAIYTRPIRAVEIVDRYTIRLRTEVPYPLMPTRPGEYLDPRPGDPCQCDDRGFQRRPHGGRHRPVPDGQPPQRRPDRVRAQRRLLGRGPAWRACTTA